MKKFLSLFIILSICLTGCNNPKKSTSDTKELNIVTSLEDKIDDNSIWCGTFNIIWNELKENSNSEITTNPEKEQVTNLNKSTFTKEMLDIKSYYIAHGKKTLKFKAEIEKNIKEKFNQKSDILDNFNWEKNSDDEFYYSMLYKKFNFETPFKELKKYTFNDSGEYRYFGINNETRVGAQQVKVLYYTDNNNFAVKLTTKENDEIILLKTENKESNFLNYYNALKENSEVFEGSKYLQDTDTLLVPYIKFNAYKEFKDLEKINIEYKNGDKYIIGKAVQTIKLELNESGGEIKSEAGIDVKATSAIDKNGPRNFNFTSDFVIFLKENDKELPYFAANINSLEIFQNN